MGLLQRVLGLLSPERPARTPEVTVPCPVCANLTLKRDLLDCPAYSICPVCFWEDELWPGEELNPSAGGGPNHVNLDQARQNYRAFGAVEQRLVPHVRNPTLEEAPHV